MKESSVLLLFLSERSFHCIRAKERKVAMTIRYETSRRPRSADRFQACLGRQASCSSKVHLAGRPRSLSIGVPGQSTTVRCLLTRRWRVRLSLRERGAVKELFKIYGFGRPKTCVVPYYCLTGTATDKMPDFQRPSKAESGHGVLR